MSSDEKNEKTDPEEQAPAPADQNSPPPEPKPGLIKRFFGSLKRGSQAILTVGVVIWMAIFLLIFWSSGLIDYIVNSFSPETPGIIHIESPQIYTRERLVNDRFREQAWLEKQLAELEERAQLISSYRKDSVRLSATSRPSVLDDDNSPEQPPANNNSELEENLLVSADDSFNLQRNVRATIRRALIENQLDDRHDLGSNSLYQLNFGAAIIAGTRTRRIAAIEMEIEPVDPLQPLDKLITDDSACSGLREYECAYLFDAGILKDPTDRDRNLMEQYDRWRTLFQKWLGAENAAYQREADDISQLLSSPQASDGIRTQMKPFFNNLNRLAQQYMDSFDKVTFGSGYFNREKCKFTVSNKEGDSVENELLSFIRGCVDETNLVLEQLGDDRMRVEDFLKRTLSINPKYLRVPPGQTRGEMIWGEYFVYVFSRFNSQCTWGQGLVEQIGPSSPDDDSSEPVNEQTAATDADATISDEPTRYRLTVEVETSMLACIARSVIRDYGSHPFGKVERDQLKTSSGNSGAFSNRPNRSTYRAQLGLSSIVVTSRSREFRSGERIEPVGIASRYSANLKDNGLERYPHDAEVLNRTCRHYPATVADSAPEPEKATDSAHKPAQLLAGVTSAYYFGQLRPQVDPEIGWSLLSHIICADHSQQVRGEDDNFVVNNYRQLPIGLFRFIGLLSGNQKTFSYSVQPSGAFNLQRRDQSVSWNLTHLLTGPQRGDEISASGDTTESWIEKQYRIIGFGAQVDHSDEDADDPGTAQRKANFGWYVFPAETRGGLFSFPAMRSANIKLSALVSLPAWWESVNIKVTTSWRHIDSPGTDVPFKKEGDNRSVQNLRIELPTRLEFIRNHFPNTAAIRPSLYQLHLPTLALRACEEAAIVLKGERLWRSTVVTLGSQKSSLIQVMPDMRGIIAHFDQVVPFDVEMEENENSSQADTIPVTIWTSEGQKSVVDTVSITVPKSVKERMREGLAPCSSDEDVRRASQ